MNPYETYERNRASGWTRIDMLLALYDGAIARLEQAHGALARGDTREAAPLLLRTQRIVVELLGGIDLAYGEVPRNLQRLYLFVLQALAPASPTSIAGALKVLRTLRDGLQEVRSEAVELERSGTIPPVDSSRTLHAVG